MHDTEAQGAPCLQAYAEDLERKLSQQSHASGRNAQQMQEDLLIAIFPCIVRSRKSCTVDTLGLPLAVAEQKVNDLDRLPGDDCFVKYSAIMCLRDFIQSAGNRSKDCLKDSFRIRIANTGSGCAGPKG